MDIHEGIEARLDLIDTTDASLKAWTTLDRNAALSARRLGPLGGMAIAIKDIIDVKGLPTTAGSKVLQGNIATADAPVVARLRRAGAVIMGKTNTHEFAYGYVCAPTCNPWDLTRIPGGSSGGSAAAVAAGHVSMALGSDTGGSIRVPAALCGVSGLKPRLGIVPTERVIPLSPRLDTVGPIADSVANLIAIWEVIADRKTDVCEKDFRLGIPQMKAFGDDVEADVASAYLDSVEVIGKIASSAHDITVPDFDDFNIPRAAIVLPDALQVHRDRGWWPKRKDDYTQETSSYMTFMQMSMSPEMIRAGEQEAARLSSQLLEVFNEVDVVVTPSCPCAAPTHEKADEQEEGSPRRPIAMKLARLASAANLSNLAAITLPCGFTEEGLPVGLQLMAKDEDLLLYIGSVYQQMTDWHLVRPVKPWS